jgi:hypothetical protein
MHMHAGTYFTTTTSISLRLSFIASKFSFDA